ncbi:hypothetical protein [Kutzneria sp. 744]|uniref:hypothetical protein n=1 Tax=Kutzneria sp. (strain 744) TaxID=345341 RepID=UPI0003EEBC9D|nr:hypothetical protein [Kutzneria sp. 744]EWM11952.1 hypothetical protein KUTG_02256 [Kutzneria sp. 744]
MHFDFDAKVAGPVLHGPALEAPEFDAPELTPLTKPLAEATVGLIVTSGAYYPEQMRLGERTDLSYRLLSRHRELTDILFAHKTPIRQFGLADPNVAYPRDTMVDLEQAGVFAHYAENAVSMVGSISRYVKLATETAPRIVDEFADMGVDLVLVVPFCPPQCHNAAGVLARALERRGLPTTSLTTLYRHAMAVKPPRDLPGLPPRLPRRSPRTARAAGGDRPRRPGNRCRPRRRRSLAAAPAAFPVGRRRFPRLGAARRRPLPGGRPDPRHRPRQPRRPRREPQQHQRQREGIHHPLRVLGGAPRGAAHGGRDRRDAVGRRGGG